MGWKERLAIDKPEVYLPTPEELGELDAPPAVDDTVTIETPLHLDGHEGQFATLDTQYRVVHENPMVWRFESRDVRLAP